MVSICPQNVCNYPCCCCCFNITLIHLFICQDTLVWVDDPIIPFHYIIDLQVNQLWITLSATIFTTTFRYICYICQIWGLVHRSDVKQLIQPAAINRMVDKCLAVQGSLIEARRRSQKDGKGWDCIYYIFSLVAWARANIFRTYRSSNLSMRQVFNQLIESPEQL